VPEDHTSARAGRTPPATATARPGTTARTAGTTPPRPPLPVAGTRAAGVATPSPEPRDPRRRHGCRRPAGRGRCGR
jgi:hypothetical protein